MSACGLASFCAGPSAWLGGGDDAENTTCRVASANCSDSQTGQNLGCSAAWANTRQLNAQLNTAHLKYITRFNASRQAIQLAQATLLSICAWACCSCSFSASINGSNFITPGEGDGIWWYTRQLNLNLSGVPEPPYRLLLLNTFVFNYLDLQVPHACQCGV